MIISAIVLVLFLSDSTIIGGAVLTPASPKDIIVGGGPAGLASALLLEARGWKDITVLEMRPKETIEKQRAYLYLIDGRGLRVLERLDLLEPLRSTSVSSRTFTSISAFFPDRKVKRSQIPASAMNIEKYWLSRQSLLDIFHNKVDSKPTIKVLYETSCAGVRIENGKFLVSAMGKGNQFVCDMEAELLLGCEGINSPVRRWLQSIYGDDFNITKLPSPAAGLLYRIITLLPNFSIPSEDPESQPYKSTTSYSIRYNQSATLQIEATCLMSHEKSISSIILFLLILC